MFDLALNKLPVIGIRAVIDPRRKVYNRTYGQTQDMASSVADYLSDHVKYPNSLPLKCVVYQKCVSNIVEAQECSDYFKHLNVGAVITVATGWCYPLETMLLDAGIPHAVWGFNGTERPGAVFLAALTAACNLKGLPMFKIYGKEVREKDDKRIPEDVGRKLLSFTRAALAASLMKGKSYLSLGTVSMGISGCISDELFFQQYLGMRISYVDMSEIQRRMNKGIYDPEELSKAIEWFSNNCKEGVDYNDPSLMHTKEQKAEDARDSIKLAIIVKDMMKGNQKLQDMGYEEEAAGYGAVAGGFQGQRAWTDQNANGDFMEAILNSTFDWNGRREPIVIATENDSSNAVSMLFGYLLTHTPQIFCDVRTYWSPETVKRITGEELEGRAKGGMIHLLNSGAAALEGSGCLTKDGKPVIKPYWEMTEDDIKSCLQSTRWSPAMLDQFLAGGFSSTYSTKGEMPVTITRLNMVYGIGPVLQIAEGYTYEASPNIHMNLLGRTDPTWPSTWFVPNTIPGDAAYNDVYSVMESWGANHCSMSYGHIGSELITLASMLRIPVTMHNVETNNLFRPALWKAYGTKELEAADRYACAALGPLYK